MNFFEGRAEKGVEAAPAGMCTIGDLTVDLAGRTVSRAGERLLLPDLSFDLLARLVRGAPEPVPIPDLARDVWCLNHVTDETVAQRVALLRRALGDDPKEPRYVRTVRGSGYAIAAPVVLRPIGGQAKRRRKAMLVVAGGGLLAVLALAVAGVTWTGTGDRNDRMGRAEAPLPSAAEVLALRAQEQLNVHQAAETDRAISMLSHALALEPGNDRVRIEASFALSTRATKFRAREGDAAEAERLARAVLAKNSAQGRAWHALGYALDAQGRIDEALAAYRRAYELNPADGAAMSSAAYLFSIRGRLFDALNLEVRALRTGHPSRYGELQIAHELDLLGHPAASGWWKRARAANPGQAVLVEEGARRMLRAARPGAALRVLSGSLDDKAATPEILRLTGRAHLARGERTAARRAFAEAGQQALVDLAALDALAGNRGRAADALEEIRVAMTSGDTWPELRIRAAELNAALGDRQAALAYLSRAVDLGWRDAAAIEESPFLAGLRHDRRWQNLKERIRRELAAQRALVESDAALRPILGRPVQGRTAG